MQDTRQLLAAQRDLKFALKDAQQEWQQLATANEDLQTRLEAANDDLAAAEQREAEALVEVLRAATLSCVVARLAALYGARSIRCHRQISNRRTWQGRLLICANYKWPLWSWRCHEDVPECNIYADGNNYSYLRPAGCCHTSGPGSGLWVVCQALHQPVSSLGLATRP